MQVSCNAPPPLPGGYKVGEKVFFTTASQTLSNGDKIVHGQQGEVTGPATLEATKGKSVAVLFLHNKGSVSCLLAMVRHLRTASAATHPARPRPLATALLRHAPQATPHTPIASVAARAVAQRPQPRRPRAPSPPGYKLPMSEGADCGRRSAGGRLRGSVGEGAVTEPGISK